MSRYRRNFQPGLPAHVVHRGNNRQVLFRDTGGYLAFRHFLAEALSIEKAALHSYVLMPNHVHLLVSAEDATGISRVMQRVARRFAVYINACYQRTGTLWEGRFHASVIRSDRYLLACHRYIDLNPVRARLVAAPASYPWSSHAHYAVPVPDSLLTPHPLVASLGKDRSSRAAAYRGLFEYGMAPGELDDIRRGISAAATVAMERPRVYRVQVFPLYFGQGTARNRAAG